MYNSEQLLSPDLDVEAYLRYALHSTSLTAEQTRLTGCLSQLKEDMQDILADNADGMVGQLQASHAAQRDVGMARQSVDSLTRATDRLRLMIEEPYSTIQRRITELEHTNEAVDVLRDVLKFISLSSRLQELMTPAVPPSSSAAASAGASGVEFDITRAARALKELEDLCQVADIRGIEVVEARMSIVEKLSTTVRTRTHELLSVQDLLRSTNTAGNPPSQQQQQERGIRHGGASPALNRAVLDMGTALQCAYTLGNLTKVVHGFMIERKREALKAIMRELDPQTIAEDASNIRNASGGGGGGGNAGGPSSPIGGGAGELVQATQEALLSHIRTALYMVVQQTQCAILLWRVLLRRQDALTQSPLFRALELPVQLLLDYWNAVMDKLRERLVALQKRADFEAALSAAYPQFRLLLESMLSSSGDLAGAAAAAAAVAGAIGGGGSGASGGGGSSSSTGGATAMSDSATSLLLFNMPQWGLGDYMDLLQVVDAAANPAAMSPSGGSAALLPSYTASAASVEGLKRTWVSLVADDLQKRFSAQLMDRHREKLSPILSKLSSLTPSSASMGGQALNVTAADTRRGSLPPAASALDLTGYTRLALQDCYAYRQDPLALGLAVACVLNSTQQLLTRMREACARYPLPPLPAVTTSVTRTQLMHICIANGCTTLVHDLSSILALLPEQGSVSSGGTAKPRADSHGTAEADSGPAGSGSGAAGGGAAAELAEKQVRLRETVEAFRTISECATLPFLSSARVTLTPAVTYCVEVAYSSGADGDNRAILQLSTRLDVFLNHYYLLVDPRTSAWADATRRLADALIARLLAQCATVTLGKAGGAGATTTKKNATAVNRALANCVQESLIILLSFASVSQSSGGGSSSSNHTSSNREGGGGGGGASGIGRSTLMLKGCAKQTELFYNTLGSTGGNTSSSSSSNPDRLAQELQAILKPLYPLLARLLLVQQGQLHAQGTQPQGAPRPPAALDNAEKLTEVVEQGLMQFCQSSPPSANAVAERQSCLPAADLAQRTREADEAAATHFPSLSAAAAGTDAMVSVLAQVWQSVSQMG